MCSSQLPWGLATRWSLQGFTYGPEAVKGVSQSTLAWYLVLSTTLRVSGLATLSGAHRYVCCNVHVLFSISYCHLILFYKVKRQEHMLLLQFQEPRGDCLFLALPSFILIFLPFLGFTTLLYFFYSITDRDTCSSCLIKNDNKIVCSICWPSHS